MRRFLELLNMIKLDIRKYFDDEKKRFSFEKGAVLVLSLLLPLIVCVLIFASNNMALGANSPLDAFTGYLSDAKSQYSAFFRYMRRALTGEKGENLFYSASKLFGGDMLSLAAYYLFSPYNFLIVLFPEKQLSIAILWIQIFKIATAGLTAGIYLSYHRASSRNGFVNLAFSCSYALCSYVFGYSICVFWLDSFLILPLVALGLEFLIEKRGVALYIFSLSYALLTCWYTGYMVCVFVLVYFVFLWLAKARRLDSKKAVIKHKGERIRPWIRLVLSTLAVVGIAAPILSIVFTYMIGGKASLGLAQGFRYPFDFLRNLGLGCFTSFGTEVPSNDSKAFLGIYIGAITLVFASLYFFSSQYSLQERICRFGPLLFYFLAMLFLPLDTILHGLAVPTWFPSRYAYCFPFLAMAVAADGYAGIKKVKSYGFIAPVAMEILIILACYLFKVGDDYVYSLPASEPILFFLALIFASLLRYETKIRDEAEKFFQKKNWKLQKRHVEFSEKTYPILLSLGIIAVSCAGVALKGQEIISDNVEEERYSTLKEVEDSESFQHDLDKVQKLDPQGAYRLENTWVAMPTDNTNDNDPLYYGFNGLSCFSSTDKEKNMQFMKTAGFFNNQYAQKFDYGSTLSMESFLGLKYILDREDNHGFYLQHYLKRIGGLNLTQGTSLYQNPYALPLAFAIDKQESEEIPSYLEGCESSAGQTYKLDAFEWQNLLWSKLLGYDDFQDGPLTQVKFTYQDEDDYVDGMVDSVSWDSGVERVKAEVYTGNGYSQSVSYYNVKKGGKIRYTFRVPNNNIGYCYFSDFPISGKDVSLYIDGLHIENNTYWHDSIASIEPTADNLHYVSIIFSYDEKNIPIRDGIYYESVPKVNEITSSLRKNSVKDTLKQMSSSCYEGTLTLEPNHPDTLLVTLPNESGLHVAIDGVDYPIETAVDIFTSVDISALKAGNYDFVIYFADSGLWLGMSFSALTMLVVALYLAFFDDRYLLSLKRKSFFEKEYWSDFWNIDFKL